MMEKCFITGLACKGIACVGLYHEASQQCKVVMAINRYLGHIDGPVEKVSPKQQSPLVSDAMKAQPDMTQITWLVKGNKDARDTDSFAYAFVFKYDAAAKAATDELRPESYELYTYLKENNNSLALDGFVYSLNQTETLFARNKARE